MKIALLKDTSFQIYDFLTGHFPLFIFQNRKEDIIQALIKCSCITEETLSWAESRKEALHSLTMVLTTLGIKNSGNTCTEIWFKSR